MAGAAGRTNHSNASTGAGAAGVTISRPPAEAAATRLVTATQTGYYEHARRRPGDVFRVTAEAYADSWMDPVSDGTPERTTGAQAAINRSHDAALDDLIAGGAGKDAI
jgi:hypothetical protein